METTIQKSLEKLEGKLLSIKRDTVTGKYELEIGFPKSWVYKKTNTIDYEIIHETENATLLRIFSINDETIIDDLINFANIIIDTNQELAEMEDNFNKQMEKTKEDLEKQVKEFYNKLDKVKEDSFKSIDEKISETKKEKVE